ncbi:hypothetical protein SAMN02745831_01713 [Streptomyces sp. PgraA7]|nr:hypothetical protein SAMN02745831_01713 [Streptomyces sp. PgraA7]
MVTFGDERTSDRGIAHSPFRKSMAKRSALSVACQASFSAASSMSAPMSLM